MAVYEKAVSHSTFDLRIIYSLLKPAAQIADWAGLSLKELSKMLDRVYYQTKKEKGLTLPELATELGVGVRHVRDLASGCLRNGGAVLRDGSDARAHQHLNLLDGGCRVHGQRNITLRVAPVVVSPDIRLGCAPEHRAAVNQHVFEVGVLTAASQISDL